MTEQPLTPQNLGYVLANLWPRGEEELRRLGLTKADAFQRFWEYSRMGKCRCLVADKPVVVVGLANDGAETFTWFQATEEFTPNAKWITKYLRAELKGLRVCIYSVCVHPETEKWFRLLGFHPTDYECRLPTGYVLRKFEKD